MIYSMNYKHQHSPTFEKELKALSKKYKSLKEDIEKLKKEIEKNPLLGTSLGGGYKKIRLNITSKNQGKSGGARVITHEEIIINISEDDTKSILYVSIYDKSDIESKKTDPFKDFVKEFREKEKNQLKKKKRVLQKNNKPIKNLRNNSSAIQVFCAS